MLPFPQYHAVKDDDNPDLLVNIHSHGYRQLGFPEICFLSDAKGIENKDGILDMLNAIHSLYNEAYSYGIPFDVCSEHIFDDIGLGMIVIPVICYDEECLMFVKVDSDSKIVHDYQKFAYRDKWQGIEMDGKWIFERKYAPVVFNEQLMKERILRYLSEV